ncbi:hypothetical protein Vqi01_58300 [Micromonospora qiuiae]|uniref:CsbD family protein n=2 Tax=Micromonospora qiuiae TaxID=502268 RepID=A0ABQ4JJ89_9ACTN|nr:hypothetical protein Vqi01_58300 [Micromonospora qiuiae]
MSLGLRPPARLEADKQGVCGYDGIEQGGKIRGQQSTERWQVMASIGQRIKGFLGSPQGRKMVDRGRREATKPSTQAKLRQFAERMTGGSSSRR